MLLKKLESGLKPSDEKAALEYLDIHCKDVVTSNDWTKIDQKLLKTILKRDTLSIPEGDLFEAVVLWGKAECKRQTVEPNAENLQKVLSESLPLIRFPTMTMQEVAAKVTPTNLLSSDQILQVFTYLGSKDSQKENLKVSWPTKPRKGRRPTNWFSWDPNRKGSQIVLSDKNTVASLNYSSWCSIFGDIEITSGVAEWEIVLDQYDTTNSYNVAIGVVPSGFTNWSHSTLCGYNSSSTGWTYVCGNGNKCNNASPVYYGSGSYQGAVIRVRVNLDAHTIEFFVNGTSLGVAYTNVYGPVRPCVSMVQNQRITLRFPQ